MFALDEAPLTCEAFVAEGGMQMFLRVLEVGDSICGCSCPIGCTGCSINILESIRGR